MADNMLTKSLLKLSGRSSPNSFNYKKANGLQRKPTQKISQQELWLLPSVSYKLGNRKSKEIAGFNNVRLKLVLVHLLESQNLSTAYLDKLSYVGT